MATLMDEAAICNMALFRIGVSKTIASLEDSSQQGVLCKKIYPAARDFVLASYPWPFATRETSLAAPISGVTYEGYEFAYARPNAFIRMIEIWSGQANPSVSERVKYEFRSNETHGPVIVCNDEGPIVILYVARVTAPELFTQHFCEAVSWKMAVDLGMALTVKQQLLDRAQAYFDKSLAEAAAQNINEIQQEQPFDGGDIIRARE